MPINRRGPMAVDQGKLRLEKLPNCPADQRTVPHARPGLSRSISAQPGRTCRISGAMYRGEPQRVSARPCGCRARAKPKSPILRTPPAPGLLSSRFCGFRSLYDTRAKRTDQQGGLHDIRAMPKCIRYLSSLAIRSDTTASSSVIACNRTIGPHAASAATSAIDGEAVAASKPRHAES